MPDGTVIASSRLDWALRLAHEGFRILPIQPDSKEPYPNESWTDIMTTHESVIRAWHAERPGCNFAACPGELGVIIDLDTKKADGVGAFELLELEHGAVDTFSVSTPSNGRHVYFKVPTPVGNSSEGFPAGIDVRGSRGYVLLPGSTVGGRDYEALTKLAIADAPAWILSRLRKPGEKDARRSEPLFDLDLPASIDRAREFLSKRAPAIEGRNGNDHTYATACQLKDFGLSDESALRLMLAPGGWNDSCDPPWSPRELAELVEHAYRYGQRRPGDKGGGLLEMYDAMYGVEAADNHAPEEPVSFAAVLARKPAPVVEIVPGIIERGIATMFSGPGGSNKSRLALQWGLCIAAGVPIFGRPVVRSHFVYLSSEDDADEVTRRAQSIARRLGVPNNIATATYWDRRGRNSALAVASEGGEITLQPFHDRLRDRLCGIPGHKFVVLDSLYDYVVFPGRAKIDEGAVNAFIKQTLEGLCAETDSTLLVLWHPSQAGQERGDSSGWSVAFHNAPRARISIKAEKTDGVYTLKVEKRSHGAKGAPITLHWSDGVLLPRTELQANEQRSKFAEACITLAVDCAERGFPIQGQKRLEGWHLDVIEEAAGFRPADREVKAELGKAAYDGKLAYVRGSQHKVAGYYPADNAEDRAREAKRAQRRRRGEDELSNVDREEA